MTPIHHQYATVRAFFFFFFLQFVTCNERIQIPNMFIALQAFLLAHQTDADIGQFPHSTSTTPSFTNISLQLPE